MNSDGRRIALRTSLIYWAAGVLWILLSDRILSIAVDDPSTSEFLQSIKGWAFVTVTAFLLFAVLNSQMKRRGIERTSSNDIDALISSINSTSASTTEPKAHPKASDQNQRMLQMVLDNIPQGVFWKDRDSRWIGCNSVCIQAAGLESADAILGKREGEFGFYDKDQVKGFVEMDRHVIESGKPVLGHVESATFPDGSVHILETSKIPLKDESGDTVGVLGTWQDITERRRAEELAQRMWQQTSRLFEMSPLPAILFDKSNSRIVEVNNRFLEMFESTREEAIGKTGLELGLWVDLDQRDRLLKMIAEGQAVEAFAARIRIHPGDEREMLLYTQEIEWIHGPSVMIQGIDMSRKAAAEKALRESEARYRGIVEDQTEFIVRWLPDGTRTFVNEAYARYFGRSPDEMIGDSFFNLIPEEEREAVRRKADSVSPSNPLAVDVHRALRHDGELRWQQWVDRAIFDEDGALVEWQSVGRDIHDLKIAEEQLKSSRELAESLIEHAADAIYLHDLDGNIVMANQLACDQTGYSPEELQEMKVWEVEARLNDPEELKAIWADMEPGIGITLNGSHRRKDGSTFPVEIRVAKISSARSVLILAFARDATERTKAEAALSASESLHRSLSESSAVGIWHIDPEGRTVYANPNMCKMLEVDGPENLETRINTEFFTKESRAIIRREFEKRARGITSQYEAELVGDRGGHRNMLISGAPLMDREGSLLGMMGTFVDITENRRMERQLREAQKMEAIGHLAGGIAHDFNNILGTILGNAHLAELDLEKPHPAHECVLEIQKAGQRAKNLVRQILAFSRQETPERSVIDLAPVVDEAAKLLRATLPAGVAISVESEEAVPPVLADSNQIHQVIINLCTNAWHAMEDRGGTIRLKLSQMELDRATAARTGAPRDGRHVVLSVEDDGCGIEASALGQIFDPFFTTKDVGMGTGLGLSVVHGIMQNHEGTIRVESAVKKGTTFHLYFPASETEITAWQSEAGAEKARGHGQHILYIDDEESLVFLTSRLLERTGYRITGITSPSEALDLFRKDPESFDVVVTDFNMPGSNGLKVSETILGIKPETLIVLTTGFITDDLREKAAALGIRHVVYKPNTVEELSESIHSVLAERGSP